jgi:membrane associated rhomboid family serine protease
VLVGIALGAAVALLLARRLRAPREVAPISLGEVSVRLPLHDNSPRSVEVPLAELSAAELRPGAGGPFLLLATRRRRFAYRVGQLLDPQAAPRFLDELRRRPHVTWVLAGLLAAVFAVELATGALGDPDRLVRLGAGSPVLVREGQVWRLVTANLLHAGWIHLYVNATSLLYVGGVVEAMVGPWRFLVLFLASALGGSTLSSALARSPYGVGASTALFGILGAFAVLNWRFRAELPPGLAQSRRWWITTAVLNLVVSLLPFVDGSAHAGGLATGASLSWLLLRRTGSIGARPRPSPAVPAAGVALACAFAAAVAAAAAHALDPGVDHRAEAYRGVVRWPGAGPDRLNQLAWSIAIDHGATAASLDLALEAAARAHRLAAGSAAIVDTLATVYHRLGRHADAVRTELQALSMGDDPFFWFQLARFAEARAKADGARGPGHATSVEALEAHAREVRVRLREPLPAGATVYAWVQDEDGRRLGLLRLVLAPGASGEVRLDARAMYEASPRRGALRLEPAVVDARPTTGLAPGATYREIEPSVLGLP